MTPQPSLSSPPQQTYQSDRPTTNGYNGQNDNGQNNNGSNGGSSNGAVTPIPQGSNTRSTNGWQMQAPQLINPRDQMTQRNTSRDGAVLTVSAPTAQLRTAGRPDSGATLRAAASDLEIADAQGWESLTAE